MIILLYDIHNILLLDDKTWTGKLIHYIFYSGFQPFFHVNVYVIQMMIPRAGIVIFCKLHVYPELIYMLFKFGVNPFIRFKIMGQNVILSGWSTFSLYRNESSMIKLQSRVVVQGNSITECLVSKSSHVVSDVRTDTHIHTHTHTHTHTHPLTHTHTHHDRQTNRVIRSKA